MTDRVLAIHGKMRSGKDTFANEFLRLVAHRQPEEAWKRWGVGDVLRRELGEFLGQKPEHLFHNPDAYRQSLIDLGKKRRAEDPLYLVNGVSNPATRVMPVRFPNEYDLTRRGAPP
jgi:hypothetical protein